MHILIASTYHRSAHFGGNEQYTHYLAEGLAKKGHRVTYLAGVGRHPGLNTYHLVPLPLHHLLGKPLPPLSLKSLLTSLSPDLIHATGSGLPLLYLAAHYHARRLPTLLTYQAPTHPSLLMTVPATLEQYALPHVFSHLIATSPTMQQSLKTRYPHTPAFMVPMMVSPHFAKLLPGKKTARQQLKLPKWQQLILFVGQLSSHHYYKGFEVFLRALALLPNCHGVVVGTGDRTNTYKQLAARLNLNKRLHFAGFVPENILPLYYKSADLFVLPSLSDSEGFGLVLIEAMTVGAPTLTTTAIAAAPWFKKTGTTTLVIANNPQALSQAITRCLTHKDAAKIKRARRFARRFTPKRMVENTLAVYKKVLTLYA